MKYYLISGEASGDLHGSNLMAGIKKLDSNAEFRFWGGDLMQNQGGHMVSHNKERSFMGFVEVIKNLPFLKRLIKQCKDDIKQWQPDAVVFIDYPGFNLRIAPYVKSLGIQTHYYISPKVWAWNTKRALKIKECIDHMYCILPFEVDFYKQYNYEVHYVGNPLLDSIVNYVPNEIAYLKGKKVVTLLPGSRKHEITSLLPIMIESAIKLKTHHIVIAGAPSFDAEFYHQFTKNNEISIEYNRTYDILKQSDVALVCSGTATLETALFNVPQVVCYKTSFLNYLIAKMVIKVKYVSLVNLLMGRALVKEMLQADCNANNLTSELTRISTGEPREQMLNGYKELQNLIGKPGASGRAAELIYSFVKTS